MRRIWELFVSVFSSSPAQSDFRNDRASRVTPGYGRLAVFLALTACCNRTDPKPGESEDARSLWCELPARPVRVARFVPQMEPFSCDPLRPAEQTRYLEAPVLVGASTHGLLVAEGLSSATPMFFTEGEAGVLERIQVFPTEFVSDGHSWQLSIVATETFFSAGTITAPLIRLEEGLIQDYSRAAIELQLETASATGDTTELLEGVDNCEDVVTPVAPIDSWWGAEYFAVSPTTDEWLYVVGLLELAGSEPGERYFAFYGKSDEVRQREVLSFVRWRDGRTRFALDLDGEQWLFEFPGGCERSPVSHSCPGVAQFGDETVVFEPRFDRLQAELGELSFECRYVVGP